MGGGGGRQGGVKGDEEEEGGGRISILGSRVLHNRRGTTAAEQGTGASSSRFSFLLASMRI